MESMIKKINFRQPKYILPAIIYLPLLGTGYFICDMFATTIESPSDTSLKSTDYLNAELPEAKVSDEIGNKRKNMSDAFGNISDLSGVENVENDIDSLNKKEEYESQYSEADKRQIEQQNAQNEEIKRLKELNERLMKQSRTQGGGDNYVVPMTDEERQRALDRRRSDMFDDLDRDLGNDRRTDRSSAASEERAGSRDSTAGGSRGAAARNGARADEDGAVRELSEDASNNVVVKVPKDESSYFNTLSSNSPSDKLIKAIVDEEIKAVNGSRVRLRLLDDVMIGDVGLKKGTCLYAVMSGFGNQRVKGKVESIMVNGQLIKIGLSIYDIADGMEGLYVPESQFRETAKDIGSSAFQSGSMSMDGGTEKSDFARQASQVLTNAYQRTTSAISKAIRKNKVRIKYGTQVYLINASSNNRQKR